MRKLLHSAGFMDENMFVGTVEKMQGQEADTVLVCYSMWNEEAVAGSKFIYSLNRFNVGITRGALCSYTSSPCTLNVQMHVAI